MGASPSKRFSRAAGRSAVYRWECPCQDPPVLLATYEANGKINIKVRDRYWHVIGQVRTVCPRCGADHVLDLRGSLPPGEARSAGSR
jgi:hypothetical protein